MTTVEAKAEAETKLASIDDAGRALECLGHVRRIVTEYMCDDDIVLSLAILPEYTKSRARDLFVNIYLSNKYTQQTRPPYPKSVNDLVRTFTCKECGVGCRFMAKGLCTKCEPYVAHTICNMCGNE